MSQKISAQLQTPADENGQRTDIHLVTTTDEVIVDSESDTPSTLTDYINKDRNNTKQTITISGEQPKAIANGNIIWFQPLDAMPSPDTPEDSEVVVLNKE